MPRQDLLISSILSNSQSDIHEFMIIFLQPQTTFRFSLYLVCFFSFSHLTTLHHTTVKTFHSVSPCVFWFLQHRKIRLWQFSSHLSAQIFRITAWWISEIQENSFFFSAYSSLKYFNSNITSLISFTTTIYFSTFNQFYYESMNADSCRWIVGSWFPQTMTQNRRF